MRVGLFFVSLLVTIVPGTTAYAYEELTNKNAHRLDTDGLILLEVNWGRQWGCAGLDNAQLQKMTFVRMAGPADPGRDSRIKLKTPSRLFVDNRYQTYALLVEPGVYALSGFDIKVAHSTSKVGHLVADSDDLFAGETPTGGTFSVAQGEVVYIGNFSLDCSQEAVPWRYYIEEQEEFDRYVAWIREKYPSLGEHPVKFRLFSTERFGNNYSLQNNKDSDTAEQDEQR